MNNFIKTDGSQRILELQLNVLVFQEGEYYVSYCPSLDLSSYGDSVADAKNGFDEVMRDYLEQSQKNGTLHQDLTNHGWTFTILHNQKKAAPPTQVDLNIPAGLLKKQFTENWPVPA